MNGESTSADAMLLKMITLPNIANGRITSTLSAHPTRSAHSTLAARHAITYLRMLSGVWLIGLCPRAISSHTLYGIHPYARFARKPAMSPGETPPKKSPIMFPIADPHAAAGPNRNEHTTGIAFAGRNSVTPGISGTTLNGTSTAAYSAADIAHNTTIRVLRHISRNSLIAAQATRALRCVRVACLLYERSDRQPRSS